MLCRSLAAWRISIQTVRQGRQNLLFRRRKAPRNPDRPRSTPSHDDITRHAYDIYVKKGRQQGHCRRDWQQAEQDLTKEGQASRLRTKAAAKHPLPRTSGPTRGENRRRRLLSIPSGRGPTAANRPSCYREAATPKLDACLRKARWPCGAGTSPNRCAQPTAEGSDAICISTNPSQVNALAVGQAYPRSLEQVVTCGRNREPFLPRPPRCARGELASIRNRVEW